MALFPLIAFSSVCLIIGWALRPRHRLSPGELNGGRIGGLGEKIGLISNIVGIVAGLIAIFQFVAGKS